MTHHHLILPNELNHHGTLFGGIAMALADKAAYIHASLMFPEANFVTKATECFDFIAPAQAGDILQIQTVTTNLGNSSIEVELVTKNAKSQESIFSTTITFVHVENDKKAPIPGRENYTEDICDGGPRALVGMYKNYRGETRSRRIIPLGVRHGATPWHKKPQWLLDAIDDDTKETRSFALQDFDFKSMENPPKA